ncbi:MAG: heavy metal translocating P-type ATPase [Spirochaetaceae bacterium]|nr:heavy metal translocating P-type ATPase [Spirochaetaceae bacterium]
MCAKDVEAALREVPGLEHSRLNFAAGKIMIDPKQVDTARATLKTVESDADIRDSAEDVQKSRNPRIRIPWTIPISAALWVVGMAVSVWIPEAIWLRRALYLTAYGIAGRRVVFGAFRNLFRGRVVDELFLMTLATAGAFVIGEWTEAVAVMLFYSVGEALQEGAVSRSRAAIRDTMSLRVETARLVDGETVRLISPDDVNIGQVIEIRPGELVPLDGTVIRGESWMNTSALTGESVPRRYAPGDEVSAGYVNDDGVVRLRVSRIASESAISRIKRLLEEASSRKSPTENVLSRFAAVYTPVVVVLALALTTLLPVFFNLTLAESAYRAMVLLVISCPCALVVSVPLAYFAGLGRASKDKVLLRGGDVLDSLNRLDTIVFDKTGTLTEGNFRVTALHPAKGWDDGALLGQAAAILSLSHHPIAKSVRDAWDGPLEVDMLDSYREIKGMGVAAREGRRVLLAGSADHLEQHGIQVPEIQGYGSVVHVAGDGVFIGSIFLNDAVKPGAAEAIRSLKKEGITRTAMFTGDLESRGKQVAEELGIQEVKAGLLPDGKLAALEAMVDDPDRKGGVGFIGDGLNDAPVIIRADVGMAMGRSGIDLAIESADAVFMDDDPARIPELLRTARFTHRIVVGNIVFALAVKVGFMIAGALGAAPMWLAVIGDVGVSLAAVLNSLRILRRT